MKKVLPIFVVLLLLSGIIIINLNYTKANPVEDDINNEEKSYPESFNLKNLIPKNTDKMYQKSTNLCWIFTTLDMLETNLALNDYKNKIEEEIKYNFSEINAAYSLTTNYFLNDEVNENGLERKPNDGGIGSLGIDLLTGIRVTSESYMPFDDWYDTLRGNNKINIDYIKNKEIRAQVIDTIDFPIQKNAATTLSNEEFQKLNNNVKNHIMNYGGIYLSMRFVSNETLNNKTKAIYCDQIDAISNHSLTIIGWDDNYSKENFLSGHQPQNNGAWIVNNSQGFRNESLDYLREQLRPSFCKIPRNTAECQEKGWDKNSSLITNEALDYTLELNNYIIDYENNTAVQNDDGIYYISYEDTLIHSGLKGIITATTALTYDDVYQHNIVTNISKEFDTNGENKIYISDVFQRNDTNKKEYLSSVSIHAAETNTVKVYVNPNGNSIKKEDLVSVKLKSGDSETFEAGYHTLEFLELLELTGDEFAIVLEVQGTRDDKVLLKLEGKQNEYSHDNKKLKYYSNLNPNGVDGAGSYSTDFENWISYSDYVLDDGNIGLDTTIKAFTVSNVEKLEIQGTIKTNYTEGDNFDTNNLKVIAIYKDNYKTEVNDYNLLNATNLTPSQTEVTISYGNIEYKIPITVKEKERLNFDESLSVDHENKIIKNINSNTLIENITNKINTNGNISISDKENNILEDIADKIVGTGYKFKIELPSQTLQYIASVRGDINSDGIIDINDIMPLAKHVVVGDYLKGLEYIYASDIDNNDNININDAIKLAKQIITKE